ESRDAPLAARQVLRARELDQQSALNDVALSVAEAYFNLQQARGDLAGAVVTGRLTEDLARRTEKLAASLVSPVEATRAKTELARRQLAIENAQEHWQSAAAELARLLRLEPALLIEPVEPPQLQVPLLDIPNSPDDLVPVALANRPELAAHQALVQATLARLKQERLRPLMPSLVLRGASTPNPGLAGGVFGGGINDDVKNFGGRHRIDAQRPWELQN